jgi:hypothetical protein
MNLGERASKVSEKNAIEIVYIVEVDVGSPTTAIFTPLPSCPALTSGETL